MLVADFAALIIDLDGSHLKHGSKSAILIVIRDDSVPSRARLFLVFVLLNPTSENTRSASALECGKTNTNLAMVESLSNLPTPVTCKIWTTWLCYTFNTFRKSLNMGF